MNNNHNKDDIPLEKSNLVMLCYQNISGVRQAKLITKDKYDAKGEDSLIKFSTMGYYFPVYKDVVVHGTKFSGAPKQLKMVPDRKSARQSPFHKNQMVVFPRLYHPDDTPFVGCPRNQLYRALDELRNLGYEMKIGIEIEFYILKSDEKIRVIESNPESSLTSLVSLIDDFDHLYSFMKAHNIEVEIAHKECGSGQFEIVLKYGEVMKILDDYYLAKEIVAQHFRKKGYIVTYLPKPFENGPGSGAHVHVSLWRDGKNCMGSTNSPYGLSLTGENFMAGIVHYYDALVHFLCPSPNSIRRLCGQQFAGCYKVWGIENKEAPVRLVSPLSVNSGSSQFEIKSFDHTANFYLALAFTIIYGIKGIRNNLLLPQPFNEDADLLTEHQRKELGIKMLPKEFFQRKSIIESFQGDPLREFFGEELINNILLVHQEDFAHFKDMDFDQEVKMLLERQ